MNRRGNAGRPTSAPDGRCAGPQSSACSAPGGVIDLEETVPSSSSVGRRRYLAPTSWSLVSLMAGSSLGLVGKAAAELDELGAVAAHSIAVAVNYPDPTGVRQRPDEHVCLLAPRRLVQLEPVECSSSPGLWSSPTTPDRVTPNPLARRGSRAPHSVCGASPWAIIPSLLVQPGERNVAADHPGDGTIGTPCVRPGQALRVPDLQAKTMRPG